MADGNMVMDTAEGRNKATEMRNIAIQIEDLLNDVSRKIDEINKIICFLVNIIVYKILQCFWAHHTNYLFFDFSFWIYDN